MVMRASNMQRDTVPAMMMAWRRFDAWQPNACMKRENSWSVMVAQRSLNDTGLIIVVEFRRFKAEQLNAGLNMDTGPIKMAHIIMVCTSWINENAVENKERRNVKIFIVLCNQGAIRTPPGLSRISWERRGWIRALSFLYTFLSIGSFPVIIFKFWYLDNSEYWNCSKISI